MNYFHLEAKVVSRGAGRSVIAAAAYASGSRLYNDYDGLTHDFTRDSMATQFLSANSTPVNCSSWKMISK